MVILGEFSIPEILEALRDLEFACAQHAVEYWDEAELKVLELGLDIQKEKNLSETDFCSSDVGFNRVIAAGSHNPVL